MLIAAKLTVDIAGTIVTLQAFGKVVGQIADEDLPSEEGLLTACFVIARLCFARGLLHVVYS